MNQDYLSTGLSQLEASNCLIKHGLNEIKKEKSRSAFLLFAEQFKSPLVIILIFACLVSLALGEKIEAVAIAAILILNAFIGFFQEFRAETAIAALQNITAPRAKVLRDGQQTVILAREIVPGDILFLEAGDIVAADAKILESARLLINESILTGESIPVEKNIDLEPVKSSINEKNGRVFMGTSVVTGTAIAKVENTGMKTELGKIAHLIASAQIEITPLQAQLVRVGKILLVICLGIVGIVAILSLIRGVSWLELLIFSVSLAVAAVPEGLPAIVTVALALGVQRMATRNALIRKLPSVEALGSVSVICTDKTGTLTTGNMRIREMWSEDNFELIRVAASCCDAELNSKGDSGIGDPTEIAILIAAKEFGIDKSEIESNNPRISSEPFDSIRKRMSVYRADGSNYLKGAIESLVSLCDRDDPKIQNLLHVSSEMAARGLRVLAVAKGNNREEKNVFILGLLGIADPPRAEVKQAILEARNAGITLIMITGDHPQTAAAIARELGLVMEGESIDARVYARATPEEKLKLVRYWKDKGEIVAMTGDGVNDAPALREAHIGIAMGVAGTEVTRQAADLILADDNFATIVAAVREGRGIFQNIRKAVTYLLTGNFAEIILVLGAITIGLPLPLLSSHLLWINLVTDALPALTLIADPLSPNLMKRNPLPAKEEIMRRKEWMQILVVGTIEAAVAIGLYWYLLKSNEVSVARSFMFTSFVFSQLFRSFGARSNNRVFWEVGMFTNLWQWGVVIITGLVQLSLHYIPLTKEVFGLSPLTLSDLFFILPFSLIPITLIETHKLAKRMWRKTSSPI